MRRATAHCLALFVMPGLPTRGLLPCFPSEDGRHAVSYEAGWRRLTDPSRGASQAVVAQLGDSLKSAASYIFKAHSFDDPSFPMRGALHFSLALSPLLVSNCLLINLENSLDCMLQGGG